MGDIHIIGWLLINDIFELVYLIYNIIHLSSMRDKLCLEELGDSSFYEEVYNSIKQNKNKMVKCISINFVLEKFSYYNMAFFLRFFFEFSDILVCGLNFLKFYTGNWCSLGLGKEYYIASLV